MRGRGQAKAGLVVVCVAGLLAAAACSGGDDDDDGSSAGSAASTTTSTRSSGTSEATTTTISAGCTGGRPTPTQPASTGDVIDIDGDGRPDQAWLSSPGNGVRELGVLTAAGGGDVVRVDSASPIALQLLVADADETPPVELFVSDGRTVQLWAFSGCKLQQVKDAKGVPYLFDLGFRGNGTGVGCVDADGDGKRDLVGVNVVQRSDTAVQWTRTIIERDGLEASNGAKDEGTYKLPQDQAKADLLYTVTCGNLDIRRDAIRQPE
jgi:hypothetical protein